MQPPAHSVHSLLSPIPIFASYFYLATVVTSSISSHLVSPKGGGLEQVSLYIILGCDLYSIIDAGFHTSFRNNSSQDLPTWHNHVYYTWVYFLDLFLI